MNNEPTAIESEQAQQIAQLQREINALRTLLSAIVTAWRDEDVGIGRIVRLVEAAENMLLTKKTDGSNLTT